MEPLTFTPLYMPRVWGGRTLETTYGRSLPDDAPYGESWEITDRKDEQSVVTEGPFAGRTLNSLWTNERENISTPSSLVAAIQFSSTPADFTRSVPDF